MISVTALDVYLTRVGVSTRCVSDASPGGLLLGGVKDEAPDFFTRSMSDGTR